MYQIFLTLAYKFKIILAIFRVKIKISLPRNQKLPDIRTLLHGRQQTNGRRTIHRREFIAMDCFYSVFIYMVYEKE